MHPGSLQKPLPEPLKSTELQNGYQLLNHFVPSLLHFKGIFYGTRLHA